MKILSVMLENLNSLQGKWAIDFTTPAFIENGLFAITGPTGAGKSTILDAICLALYHQTPRLKAITKSNCDIMTKNTGQCSAQVQFATDNKVYLATWSIRRARGKATGEVQNAIVSLTCLSDNQELATKTSDKIKLVEQITKLSYERFTKSMLLSQGQFSAFLNANDNDRSELLEQLTGTEIYSKISKRVYDEHKLIRDKITLKDTERNAKDLLSEENKTSLNTQIQQLDETLQTLTDKSMLLTQHQQWWEQYQQYEQQLTNANTRATQANESLQQQQSQLDILAGAVLANTITPSYVERMHLQSTHDKLAESSTNLQTQLPKLKAAHANAQQTYLDTQTSCSKALQAKEQLDTLISERIAPLDANIQTDNAALQLQQSKLQQIQIDIKQQQGELAEQRNQLSDTQQQLDSQQAYMDAHVTDAQLAHSLGGWQTQFTQISNAQRRFERDLTTLTSSLNATTDDAPHSDSTLHKLVEVAEQQIHSHQQILTNITFAQQPVLRSLLDQPSLQALHSETSKQALSSFLQARISEIKTYTSLSHTQSQWHKSNSLLTGFTQQHDTLMNEHALRQARLADCTEHAHKDRQLLEQQQLLQSLSGQLAQLSQALPNSDHCPLCASTEYGDYVLLHEHNTQSDESAAINVFKEAYTKSQATLTQLEKDLAGDIANLQQLSQQILDNQTQCEQYQLQWNSDSKLLSLTLSIQDQDGLDAAQSAADLVTSQLQQLLDALNAAQSIHQLTQQQDDIEQSTTALLQDIQQAGFTGVTRPLHLMQQWLADKERDFAQWRKTEQALLDSQRTKVELAQSIALIEQPLQHNLTLQTTITADIQTQQSALNGLREQRRELFGDKLVSHERSQMAQHYQSMLMQQTEAQQGAQTAHQAVLDHQQTISITNEQLASNAPLLQEASERFAEALQASVFAGEAAFLAAQVDQETLTSLQQLQQSLSDEITASNSVLQEAQIQFDNHLAHPLAADFQQIPLSDIITQLTGISGELDTARDGRSKLQGQLEHDARQTAQLGELLTEIKTLKATQHIYNTLDGLIGSADGKKFRKFAQGLTLDNLIYLANQQLHDFAGRYELARKDTESLDLYVVDRWQGDVRRDTKTLSGGESFLVSLSLALALSELVSDRVSIESLFLDEGFGTLDSDTLDTALDALDRLNAQGKMIGVISHVEALKQRISLQIKITKQSGLGISALEEQYRFIPDVVSD